MLDQKLKEEIECIEDIVFVCIGTNEVLGDCLGPLVGTYLKENSDFKVYGDMENNICTSKDIKRLCRKTKNKKVIAIDSAISDVAKIGEIFVSDRCCRVGRGIGIDKNEIGDITIKVVVAKKEKNNYKTIQNLLNVDYKVVNSLAEEIGKSLCEL